MKISTNLIQLDVTITDSKGNVIRDIKPGEVEIYENGQKQNVTNFSFVSTVKTVAEKSGPAKVKDQAGVPIPQAKLRPEQIHRTIALVVDDLSLSFESATSTRPGPQKIRR